MLTGKDIAQIHSTRRLLQRIGRSLEDEDDRDFETGRLRETAHEADVSLFNVLNAAFVHGRGVTRDDLFPDN